MVKDPEKEKRVKAALEEAGLDGILVRFPENVLYFTNYWPVTGWGLALVFRDDPPVLIYPESELDFLRMCSVDDPVPYEPSGTPVLIDTLENRGLDLAHKKIGIEANMEMLASTHLGYETAFPGRPFFEALSKKYPRTAFQDATEVIYGLRRTKTPFEVEQFALTNELNAFGLAATAEILHQEGVTEMEVATTCEKAIMDKIANFPDRVMFVRALAFVMGGPNGKQACRPFNISTAYKMKAGEYAMLELNTQVNGYWSDLTRTWVVGRVPSDEQIRQARVLNEAIDKAIAVIKPGLPCDMADKASRDHIIANDLGQWHTPFLGHGIGVKLHEPHPMILPGCKDVFQDGDYFSVEPGLYFEKMGALRFERDVILEGQTARPLDQFPCEL